MLKYCLFFFIAGILFSLTVHAQMKTLPIEYVKDSLPALTKRCEDLLKSAYMAQTLVEIVDTIPGWEGFPVKLYSYQTGVDKYTGVSKTGKVYLLNPTPEKLAMWIATTCWIVKNSVDYAYTLALLKAVRGQSGAQFPVKGVVYEDMNEVHFYEPYVFKDGVTVYPADSTMIAKNKTCTDNQLDFYLAIKIEDIKPQTGRYARIISTTREQYTANGGAIDVGDGSNRKKAWLDVVRKAYQDAWRSDKNELMIAWARQNL